MKLKASLTNNLLLFLVFLLPLQTRYIASRAPLGTGTSEYGTISIYAVELLLWLCFAVFIFSGRLRFMHIKADGKLAVIILAFVTYAIFGIFENPSPVRGFFVWLRLAEAAALFTLIAWGGVKNKWLIYSFIAGAAVQAVLGIVQFSVQGISPSTLFGIATHDPAFLGDAVVETTTGRWLRAYGSLPHPNILGGYLVTALLLLFTLAIWKKRIAKAETTMVFGILLLSAALFFTFSRGAWIAFGVGGLVLIWNAFLRNNDERFHRAIRFGLPAAALWLVLGLAFVPLLQTRFSGLVAPQGEAVRLEKISINERLSEYEDAFSLLPNYFLSGTGIGAYAKRVEEMRPGLPGYAYQPVHNFFLILALELGIPAFLIFISMLLMLAFLLYKGGRWIAFPPYIALFTLGFFDHYLWSLEAGTMLFWAVLGFVYNLKEEEI